MEVHYCHVCGTKVSSDAIDGGAALRSAANRIICGTCVTDLKPAGAELPRAVAKKVLPHREPAHPHRPHVSHTTHTSKPASKPQDMAYFVGAIAILIAGMLIFFAPSRIAPSSNAQALAEKVDSAPTRSPDPTKATPEVAPSKAVTPTPAETPKPALATISREALLAYWTFDDIAGETVKDASGQNHNGTLVNEPLPTPGKFGTALGFFGKQQYVTVKDSAKIELGASSFTFSAWIKTRAAGCLLSKTNPNGGWADQGKIVFIAEGAGRLRMDSHGIADHSGTTAVTDNNWHHVAVVFFQEKKVIKMFVDGKEDGSFDMPLEADHDNFEIRIGFGPSTSHTIHFSGLMDDVAIYGRCLKPEEIEALGNGSKRP